MIDLARMLLDTKKLCRIVAAQLSEMSRGSVVERDHCRAHPSTLVNGPMLADSSRY